MFDEFVQSSRQGGAGRSSNFPGPSSPEYGLGSRSAYSGLHQAGSSRELEMAYDGFEPDDRFVEQVPLDPIAAVETGFISSDLDPNSTLPPIFQLGRVQYNFTAPLAFMTVSANILTMCLYAYPTHAQLSSMPSQAYSQPRLVRINLDDPERTEEADVPLPPQPRSARNAPAPDPSLVGPHKMFADPTGKHLILTMRSGDNYYWVSGWKRARALPRLKGLVIDSIAWNKNSESQTSSSKRKAGTTISTGEILIGTLSGEIFETLLTAPVGGDGEEGDFFDKLARRTAGGGSERGEVDRFLRHVFTLPERQPVTGLTAEPFPNRSAANGRKGRKVVVIATTSTRIYEFVGNLSKSKGEDNDNEPLYEKLFEPYRGDVVPNLKSELPGDLPYSELHTWSSSYGKEPSALAWLTGPGVYHGLLSFSDQEIGDSVIESANLLPYPAVALDEDASANERSGQTVAEIPLSIALTDFHFLLLYQDRVMAISSLDDRVVFEEALPLKPDERVIGTAVDTNKRTFWVYSDSSIFELVVRDEDRDVWKVYLERGSFDASLKYAKQGIQRGTVLSSQGDRFFNEGRFIQAAQCYAQTALRTFEEIVLKFIDAGERDALRYYLVMRLERLKKSDLAQRIMLATWLVEIYLSKINQLEDIAAAEAASQDVENYKLEKDMLSEELLQFLSTYKDNLNPATTFGLIARHGRVEVLLHYASIIGDHERIVRHWIDEGDWKKAIDAINKQGELDLYYRFATVLMRNSATLVVECWMRQTELKPRRLIPALLQYRAKGEEEEEEDQAIRYLKHVVSAQKNTDSAIHNLLLTLLARRAAASSSGGGGGEGKSPNKATSELLAFIDTSPSHPITGSPYYDLDYALRTCSDNGQKEACVRIYAKMGLFESAVDLALHSNDVELACRCADMVENDEALKKKLWLKAAKSVVQTTKDLKGAMQYLKRTELLSIEDILPFFPDFVVIDDFKEEICSALESYATNIEQLKEEMDEATRSAEAIKRDTERLGERFVSIQTEEKCCNCERPLLSRQFYVFPCRHGFHADCLISETTKVLPQRSLRRILEIQEKLNSVALYGVDGEGKQVGGVGAGAYGYVNSALRDTKLLTNAARQVGFKGLENVRTGLGLDRLRELIVPDAVIGAITAGVSVSVAGGKRVLAPLDPFSNPAVGSDWVAGSGSVGRRGGTEPRSSDKVGGGGGGAKSSVEDQEILEELRQELDSIIASSCLLCDGAADAIARPFVGENEILDDWTI